MEKKIYKTTKGLQYEILKNEIRIVGYTGEDPVVKIPSKIKERKICIIGKNAFLNNNIVTEVKLPESVRIVGASAFEGCKSLKKVYLPVDLEVLNADCFKDCIELEEVQVPYELKKICKGAFKNCKKLKELKHFTKSGISSVMVVNRTFTDKELPVQLEYIGESSFEGCESLQTINIPHAVTEIRNAVFKDCASLEKVLLHNNMSAIKASAFENCKSLKELRVPESLTKVEPDAFKNTDVTFICEADTVAEKYAVENNVQYRNVKGDLAGISSMMIPYDNPEDYTCYYTEEQKNTILEKCEIRPAVIDQVVSDNKFNTNNSCDYELNDGVYRKKETTETNRALIRMVGDLMCKGNHQEYAQGEDGFNFDDAFALVKPLLQEGDLTIGNMESMCSASCPLTMDTKYVNDRPYLNSPDEFLGAVKNAGFDLVVNAQNHIYDAGMIGVIETLEALNRNKLMHTGVFAGDDDKRYVLVDVNGIRIAVLAYYDGARQAMKKAYFTNYAQNTIFNMFDKEHVEADIKAARAEGAEFIISYCHWGKEYTEEISKRQEEFANMVINAGADYIFGSHSHCPQPYTVMISEDGRKVPVLYSGGNFISEINISGEISRNTFVASLELERDSEGKVVIKEDGYFPCRIMQLENRGQYTVVPTTYEFEDQEKDSVLRNSEIRIDKALGVEYKKLAGRSDVEKRSIVDDGKYGKYTLAEPLMIEINHEEKVVESRYAKNGEIYDNPQSLGTKEAVLMCTGQIRYDSSIGNSAKYGDIYNFRPSVELVKSCFNKADFVIGNFAAVACDDYLSTEMMSSKYNPNKYYSNARLEYLEALKYAGFDCLAAANPNNLDAGVKGILKTKEAIENAGMLAIGIGEEDKAKVFDVNGIKVGVLSYTSECYNKTQFITAEGAELLLNIYSKPKAARDIQALRNSGAEFILCYINCGGDKTKFNLKKRKVIGREIADLGADYVICTVPSIVSGYESYAAEDGRIVPIASGIGTFLVGTPTEENYLAAMLRIRLYKTDCDRIEVADDYIPLKRFEYIDGCNMATVPALKAYYSNYKVKDFPLVKKTLKESIGDKIKVANDKIVKIDEYNKPQLTFREVYEILGETPSEEAKAMLDLDAKASIIATRKPDLREGCVAVLAYHGGYKKDAFSITVQDAIEAKAALIITDKKVKGVPCIVKEGKLKEESTQLLKAVMKKYNPIVVAITGTAGKTTTKEFTSCVFDTHYNTLHVEGNNNTFYTCGTTLQKLTSEYEAYIQEVHGGSKNSAKEVSELIEPNIAIITNIGDGHLKDLGTIENVVAAKLEIANGLKKDGVLIVNNDNEYLKDYTLPDRRVIHYSVHDTNCEYYAKDIQDFGDKVKFVVVYDKGECELVLNLQGLHNVSNALAVFVAGIEAGIPPYKIAAGLTHYIPDADKQNLMYFNGYNMIVDTYSATPISVESAMQTLSAYPVTEGTKKIAVLGDIPALGASSEEKHIEVGKNIAKYDFDLMLCVGTDSRHFAEAAKAVGKEAYSYEDRETFNRKLAEKIKPGDFILFKSGTRSHLKEETIYPLFGLIDEK